MTGVQANPGTQLIVALDVDTLDEAARVADQLGPLVPWYKIGKQLFTRHGPDAVRMVRERGSRVFLDLKYHDIPNTVAEAVRAAAGIGADLVNVHAGGGPSMLAAAAEAGQKSGVLVVAVTVLTSLDERELRATGVAATPAEQVVRLARLAQANGIPGVVCSALEIGALRQACGPEFVLVVPGIRPAGSGTDDQKRVMTPRAAAAAGADYIVVGRPIRQAPDPQAAVRQILEELKG
ncbi:MAG: orotidine 5'-phosphate decarboxylase [Lentisphaerae bacterium RIFOXYB12_FULL_65_16]|nr:MAG: orotidine 5'-phosphate decarboxylase [Lentisphaerae bacterium RIFOXYA12_64_32]OGV88352.1 MAG: orotidine 5'-phosphate decarboxylase [Lentisphaerae bacterium RIFOXYB12_FULL_65_16]